jgi:tetratricopeptide (TPR) repeat protein
MGTLGQAYLEMGRLEFARDMMAKMQEAAKESFGETSFERGRALNALGACLDNTGDKEGAEAALREAIGLSGYSGATDISDRLLFSTAHFNLGVLLSSMQRHEEAVEHLTLAVRIKSDCGMPAEHPDLIEATEVLHTLIVLNILMIYFHLFYEQHLANARASMASSSA